MWWKSEKKEEESKPYGQNGVSWKQKWAPLTLVPKKHGTQIPLLQAGSTRI